MYISYGKHNGNLFIAWSIWCVDKVKSAYFCSAIADWTNMTLQLLQFRYNAHQTIDIAVSGDSVPLLYARNATSWCVEQGELIIQGQNLRYCLL